MSTFPSLPLQHVPVKVCRTRVGVLSPFEAVVCDPLRLLRPLTLHFHSLNPTVPHLQNRPFPPFSDTSLQHTNDHLTSSKDYSVQDHAIHGVHETFAYPALPPVCTRIIFSNFYPPLKVKFPPKVPNHHFHLPPSHPYHSTPSCACPPFPPCSPDPRHQPFTPYLQIIPTHPTFYTFAGPPKLPKLYHNLKR